MRKLKGQCQEGNSQHIIVDEDWVLVAVRDCCHSAIVCFDFFELCLKQMLMSCFAGPSTVQC
jgi:hypothetical protein